MPSFVLQEEELDELAEEYSWSREEVSPNTNFMVSYKRFELRLNFWLTTGTVGSYLYHPKKKYKTQLFRRKVTMHEVEAIFINPRIHTGKGYHKTQDVPSLQIGRKRNRGDDDNDEEEGDFYDIEEEEIRPLKRSRISCMYGANCNRSNCMFEHRCRYGEFCTRDDCFYDHTDVDTSWWYNQSCRYGTQCIRGDCKFQHPNGKKEPVECRYGMHCTREDCWYEHYSK